MDGVVDLDQWRRRREVAGHPARGGNRRGEQERAQRGSLGDRAGLERLERAVGRLHPLVASALDGRGRLQPSVETELLAIIGELSVGLIGEAACRAERLLDRLKDAR